MELIYVTGAGGYLGRHLCAHLTQEHVPHVPSTQWIPQITQRDLQGVDTLVHLAQLKDRLRSFAEPDRYHWWNVDGTRWLLTQARRAEVSRFVYVSSCAVYGDRSPYAVTKRVCEQMVRERFGGITIILRVFNVYGGPDDVDSVVAKFRRGPRCHVHGSGYQTRDFIHVDDVARWIHHACGYTVNVTEDVGTGTSITIQQLAQWSGHRIAYDARADPGLQHSEATRCQPPSFPLQHSNALKSWMATTPSSPCTPPAKPR